MSAQLGKKVKVVRIMNAVAAGSDVQTSSTVDLSGYEGCLFIAAFGTLTAGQVTSIEAHQSDVSGSGFTALLGTKTGPLADGDSNDCLQLDVYRPRERYLRCIVNRATQNAVIDGVWAVLYGAKKEQPALDATVRFREEHQSPAEGTA